MRAEPRRSVGGRVMHIGGRGVIAVSMNASVVSGIIDVGIAATTITPTFVTDRRRGCRWACAPLPRGDVCGIIKRTPVGNKNTPHQRRGYIIKVHPFLLRTINTKLPTPLPLV